MNIIRTKFNQVLERKISILFRQLALLSTIIIFSFFNPKVDEDTRRNLEIKSIVLQWYGLFLHMESKDTTAFPPVSAQRLADLGICGYLSLDYQKTLSLTDAETFKLLNKVYSNSLKKYFHHFDENTLSAISNLENTISSTISISESSEDIINKACDEIKDNLPFVFQSRSGNFCEVSEVESAKNGENSSSKYAFSSKNPILSEWGINRTIVINKNKIVSPKPYFQSESFSKSLYAEALEIYSMSHNLTKEEIWIAEFWGDDIRGLTFSPPARWISILNQILKNEDVSADEMMDLYLKMGIGLYDAAIICWKNKYDHNLLRPSTFIQNNIDSKWLPFHADPEFPAYPSGHSVFGAVGSRVLEASFGVNYRMTDMSHSQRIEFVGKERSYNSFKEMAHENAYSRMIMGVHYKQDCDEGLRLGYEIADIINKTDFKSILIKDNYHL